MRVAMGTITYWSILAVLFLTFATMIKIYSDRKSGPSALQDPDGLEFSEYSRMGKQSPISRGRGTSTTGNRPPLVLAPEDALGHSQLGST